MNSNLSLNLFDNIDKLFLTLAIIVAATFSISYLLSKLGRPTAMAAIIAGLIVQHIPLSSSFFDPKTCNTFGMLGIVIFMMIVGSQLNYQHLIQRKVNILVSTLPLFVPFIIAYLSSIFIVHIYLASEIGTKYEKIFDLFFALAMSMTAFPLLSMFLSNNNRIDKKVAHLALFCASVSEILFWIILGFILLYFQDNEILNHFTLVYMIYYLLFIFGVAPKIISIIINRIENTSVMLGFVLVGCLFFAAAADSVNLHPIFGGFIFGVILPRNNKLVKKINIRLTDLVNGLLLPAYFFTTGLNANLSFLLNTSTIYFILGITTLATLGKFSGAFATGRLMGYNIAESTLLGSLLNIRGIFEIMLLNVGLEVGIINNYLYTILIAMTILTTFVSTIMSPWLNKFIKR